MSVASRMRPRPAGGGGTHKVAPGFERFGLTVTTEGQTAWLDSPEQPLPAATGPGLTPLQEALLAPTSAPNRCRRACSPDPSPAASKGATRESNDRCPGTVSAVRYDSPAHDQLTRGSCETWALWTFHHSSVCATRHLRHVIRDTFTRSLVGSAALSSRDGTQHVETWDCAA